MPEIVIFQILLVVHILRYGSCIESRSHRDTFEDVYRENSGLNNTNGRNTVTLCDEYNLKGNCINVENMNQSRCINLGYFHQPHPTVNFNNIAESINVQDSCVHVYDDVGCGGRFLKITPQSSLVCGLKLPFCWDGKASSLRLCTATFPPKYDKPTGIRGQPCLIACEVRTSAHFWCQVSEDAWDFCFPRPEQHFLGMDCEGNCSIPAKMETQYPVLYELPRFTGKWMELEFLDGTNCINLPQFNFQVIASSIAVKGNCVKLYQGIGCTNGFLEIYQGMKGGAFKCHEDLAPCNFNDVVYSVSYCNATFTELDVARTGSDGPCRTPCTTNVTYFWCDSINGSRIFCVPRDGIDYLGNSCEGSACDLPEYSEHDWFPVLYSKSWYRGQSFKMGGPNEKKCHNLQFWNDSSKNNFPKTASMDLKGHCIVVFTNIGCTGYSVIFEEVPCLHDLSECSWWDKIASVAYCEAVLKDMYAFPQGSRGSSCHNRCITRGKNYFWCAVSKNAWDFCSPRPGTDFFGNDCSDNSTCSLSDRPYMVTLYDNKNNRGNKQIINYTYGSFCHDISFKQISSINLHGNCIRLYKTKNCTGERDELVPTWMEACNSNTNMCTNDTSWLSMSFCAVDRTLSCKDTEECEDNENRQENYVVIFDEINHFGNSRRIDFNGGSNMCHNFKHDCITGVNFYNNVLSLQLHGMECVRIYANIGCTGSHLVLDVESPLCLGNFDKCVLSGKKINARSLSLCDIDESDRDSNGITLSGSKCNDCSPINGNTHYDYNHCYHRKVLDYCNPKDQNHIGETCINDNDNCVFTKPKHVAHIYDRESYAGARVTLDLGDNTHCYSIGNIDTRFPENFTIKSIDVIQTCVVVYDALACTGISKVISPGTTEECRRDLPFCTNRILSLKFCDAYLPPLFHITVGSGGHLCADGCESREKQYLGCQWQDTLNVNFYDTCLPRPI